MNEIQSVVRAYIVDNFLFGDDRGLKDGASFLDNGIIDSTGILELVAFLEEEFMIKVNDEELLPENLDSLDKVSAFVALKQGGC